MSRKKLLSLLGVVFLFCGVGILIYKFFISHPAELIGAIQIDSIPKAEVLLDGHSVGKTPYNNDKLKQGEYNLKVGDWEGKIKIVAQGLTYISRELMPTEEKSGGQILTLEKLPSNGSVELMVISDPNNASVIMDGLEKGQTSLLLKNLTAGDHTIAISNQGYADQVVLGRLVAGYRLNINVKLRKLDQTSQFVITPTPTPVASASAQIQINDNPVGYLRVRSQPNSLSSEVGKVMPGEKYDIVDQVADWVKIKFANGEGWVSKDYVTMP